MPASLVLCQWLHVGAAMLGFGAQFFVLALAPAGLGRRLEPALRPIMTGAAAVLVVTALAWLCLEAADLSGHWPAALDPASILDVLSGTAFGRAWALHLLLAGSVAMAVLLRAPRASTLGLSALTLGSLALIGHTNLNGGALGLAHRICQALHLWSAGAWLGSLVPLVLVMRDVGHPATQADAITALRRFSTSGHVVVALVLASGAGNSLLILGIRPLDASPLYLTILAGKIAVVLAMTGLALVNRYALVPRLKRLPSTRAWLFRLTVINLIGGAAAILLASALGMIDPMPDA